MADFLDADGPQCQAPHLKIETTSAAHDPRLIDGVVKCPVCGHTLNAFISLDEMTQVTRPSEEKKHA